MHYQLVLLQSIVIACTLGTKSIFYGYEPTGQYRLKRQTPINAQTFPDWKSWSGGNLDKEDPGIQEQSEDADWKDAQKSKTEHDYYSKQLVDASANNSLFEQYWHDLQTDHTDNEHPVTTIQFGLRKADSVQEPEELRDSYRRAVAVGISFDFPFYDVETRNITIATGGFCYIGENTHSWLAATQYIAPLMANFDTSDKNATILYEDLRDRIIVQWENVLLREANSTNDRFTFQTTLWKNGSIWFVYKNVPIPVASIKDTHHPRKVGLSDAYLESPPLSNKRIIHEYHRIEIKPDDVRSKYIYLIDPMPTCISQSSCDACIAYEFKNDSCYWCASTSEAGAFCSDREGKHRLHEIYNRDCKERADDKAKDSQYCASTDQTTVAPVQRRLDPFTKASRTPDSDNVQLAEMGSSGGGTLFLVVVIVLVVSFFAWIGYAYFNPMTPSGQCLIRYRPSRWHMPNSDVRYTASVHM